MIDRGIFITWELWRDKDTTLSEKALLLEIQNLSELDKGCIASNNHFAVLMGTKKEAVSRLISSLEKKGYITSNIEKGSRNHNRKITINKMLLQGKQNVISPLTNCLESKENKTINKTININVYEDFITHLKEISSIPSKVTSTKSGKKLFKSITDKQQLISDYTMHQNNKGEFAQRITAFMEDYIVKQSTPTRKPKMMIGGVAL